MRESVGEMIRQALHARRFEPGQPLSEAGLAAEMGISRGPVREALLLLAQEGLVVHSPNRGFAVVQLTSEDMEEIRQVRIPLESMALIAARPHMSEADLARLEELKDKIIREFELNVCLCTQSDMSFHSLIWDRTENSRLAGTLRNLLAPFFAYGSLFSAHRLPNLTAQLLAEQHDQMIHFLRGCDSPTADECVRFHLGL
jgi:DNA-binding GntR family transcriptional regulator